MAEIAKHIALRDARDRLIDALELGETSPLRDLPVQAERAVAPAGAKAAIPIEASQRDCAYTLWSRAKNVAATPAAPPGTGGTIMLQSPVVTGDIGYRIRSTRKSNGRWVYLQDSAEIKMGLDTSAGAAVLTGDWLDAGAEAHKDSDARIVDRGAEVLVAIARTQLGVTYRLVRLAGATQETISQADAPGNLGSLTLRTKPMTADTVIRILATSNIAGQATPPALLAIVLPVMVRPDAELGVSLSPSSIVDDRGAAGVVIAGSEAGVQYQLYARLIVRGEIFPGASAEPQWTTAAGEGGRVFRVKRPAHTPTWVDPPDFTPLGNPVPGNGGALTISTGPLQDDCVILVKAWKEYTLPGGRKLVAAVPLRRAVTVLVRPSASPPLRFQVLMAGAATSGALRLSGGQRGVFYHISKSAGGADLGRAGYFHDRHGRSRELNAGIGMIAIGNDLVVARDPWTDLDAPDLAGLEALAVGVDFAITNRPEIPAPLDAAARATRPPEPPIVDTGALAAGTTLYGLAVKSLTGLSKPLAHPVTIQSVPALTAQVAEAGGPLTRVIVRASRAGEFYSLLVNGVVTGPEQPGNGQDLTLTIERPTAGAIVEVVVRRGAAPDLLVEQALRAPDSSEIAH